MEIAIRYARLLPSDITDLGMDARRDGHRSVDRLVDEWVDDRNRFDRPGECLLLAYGGGILAGVGGVTVEPTDISLFRVRRLYVRVAARRHGVGRLIVETLLHHVRSHTGVVTVNAGTAEASAFWLRMGFAPQIDRGYTHAFALG